MKELVIYLFKSGIISGIFIVVYYFLLRPTTFFRFNRAFLLSGLVVASILPFIHVYYPVFVRFTSQMSMLDMSTHRATLTDKSETTLLIIAIIYTIGIIVSLINHIKALGKIWKLKKTGIRCKSGKYTTVNTPDIDTPFAAFNHIFINQVAISDQEKTYIIAHEKAHIDQRHWVDLLVVECMRLLQWFNPVMWFYVSMLKENHEFLADKAVIDEGVSPALYSAALINQKLKTPVFSFSHSFYSHKLNRLTMIRKSKSSHWKRIAALAVLPMLTIYMSISARPHYVTTMKDNQIVEKNQTNTDLSQSLVFVDNKESSYLELKRINPTEIESIQILKGEDAIAEYGDRGKNGVIIVTTKKNK